ncbi:uncharacterized protein EAF02_007544 [Botrytis sinoallii]|uniref:uncharacterized protein n=1 Tax=Botrytis sinoallii TaxID=1463999 RepID=UPI0019024AAE|nr:uncharacterized protein EAF02_007544 [Botrytis sinoallii]KAF7879907.1 hypothetical protein EAF02_007544 [Botrytis sinoallii]
MNNSNSIQKPNVAVEPFSDSRVSNGVDLTGLKRKSRAEGSEDADFGEETMSEGKQEERSTIRQAIHLQFQKAIRKAILALFLMVKPHPAILQAISNDKSALMQVETGKREVAEANLGQRDKDNEEEERATPSIIQRSMSIFSKITYTLTENIETSKTVAESTSFLPNEVVVKIFEAILRLPREPDTPPTSNQDSKSTLNSTEDEDDSHWDMYTNGEMSYNLGRKEFGIDNDGIIEAICFALTCPRYWIVFRDLWCYSDTNKIVKDFGLSMPQELVLAPLLETWMGEKYRRSNLLTINPAWSIEIGEDGSQGYINMFLSRSVYGQGDNERDLQKEQSLWDRYKARSQILDCSEGDNLEYFVFSGQSPEYYPKIPLPSPFRMGSSWYLKAAKQYRDTFINWQFTYSDYDFVPDFEDNGKDIGPLSCAMQRSWESFRKSAIFEWVERIQSPRDRPLTQVQDESLQVATDILELHRDVTQFDMIVDFYEFGYKVGWEEISGPFPTDNWETYAYDAMCSTVFYGHDLWEPELPLY